MKIFLKNLKLFVRPNGIFNAIYRNEKLFDFYILKFLVYTLKFTFLNFARLVFLFKMWRGFFQNFRKFSR